MAARKSAKKSSKAPSKKGAPSKSKKVAAPKLPKLPKLDADVGAVANLLHDLPPLSDVQREAFRSRFSDAQCDAWGTRTKASAVAKEAVAWCATIHRALRDFPHALGNYGEPRLAWLLECVRALQDEMAAQQQANSDVAPGVQALEKAIASGHDVRGRLLETLAVLVGAREDERAILEGASGHVTSDALTLADSLSSLAELAAGWLARGDAVNRALVASTTLGPSRVDEARAAARAIRAAAGTKTLGGAPSVRDSAIVNRAEGRVLREMRVAMQIFEAAHGRDKAIPRLVAGPGTKAVLVGHGGHAAPAVDPAPATTPHSAPASGTLPSAVS